MHNFFSFIKTSKENTFFVFVPYDKRKNHGVPTEYVSDGNGCRIGSWAIGELLGGERHTRLFDWHTGSF